MSTPDVAGAQPVSSSLSHAATDHGPVELRDSFVAHDILLLRATVARRMMGQGSSVSVDLTELRRPSSSAVGTLLWARRRCQARGISFSVHGATGATLRAMLRSGLVEATHRIGAR